MRVWMRGEDGWRGEGMDGEVRYGWRGEVWMER